MHSPLAFKILKGVIAPKRDAEYYGEEQVEAADYPRKVRRRAAMLLRLVAAMQPSFVWISQDAPPLLAEAVRLAGGAIRIFDGKLYPKEIAKADLIVLHGAKGIRKNLPAMGSERPAPPIVLALDIPADVKEKIMKGVASGVIFEWEDSLLAIPRNDSERYVYSI